MRCGEPVFQTMLQIPATMMSRPEHIPPMLKPRPNFSDLRARRTRFPDGARERRHAQLIREQRNVAESSPTHRSAVDRRLPRLAAAVTSSKFVMALAFDMSALGSLLSGGAVSVILGVASESKRPDPQQMRRFCWPS